MVALAQNESPVATAIFAAYEQQEQNVRPRGHLGASQIGRTCERALWYGYRWCARPIPPGRMLRLFETGKLEESRIFENLRAIGCTVHEVDPTSGRQFWYGDHGGHFSGSLDGAVLNVPGAEKTWHLLEAKTHNARSFSELRQFGVQRAHPKHLTQMQVYMGWAELTRALYFAVCKDTDDIYCERIAFDARLFEEARAKALRVITATEPPHKADDRCQFCDYRAVCEGALPAINCRTCLHAVPLTEGTDARWRCMRDGHEIPPLLQRGCDNHLFIPSLVSCGAPVELGDDFVVYQTTRGDYFANCGATGFPAINGPAYRSDGLTKAAEGLCSGGVA